MHILSSKQGRLVMLISCYAMQRQMTEIIVRNKHYLLHLKGTVRAILSDSLCKDGRAKFTMVPFFYCLIKHELDINVYVSLNCCLFSVKFTCFSVKFTCFSVKFTCVDQIKVSRISLRIRPQVTILQKNPRKFPGIFHRKIR